MGSPSPPGRSEARRSGSAPGGTTRHRIGRASASRRARRRRTGSGLRTEETKTETTETPLSQEQVDAAVARILNEETTEETEETPADAA